MNNIQSIGRSLRSVAPVHTININIRIGDKRRIIAIDQERRTLAMAFADYDPPARFMYEANLVYVLTDGAFVVAKDRFDSMPNAVKELELLLGIHCEVSEEKLILPTKESLVILRLKGIL